MENYERYNTVRARFGAALIDVVLFVPMLAGNSYFYQPEQPVALVSSWIVFSFLVYPIYSILCHYFFGQTLGKFVYRIKVLDVSETRLPSLSQCLLRDSVALIDSIVVCSWIIYDIRTRGYEEAMHHSSVPPILNHLGLGWYLLELGSMMLNRKSRAIHDFIASTVVVHAPFIRSADQGDAGKPDPVSS